MHSVHEMVRKAHVHAVWGMFIPIEQRFYMPDGVTPIAAVQVGSRMRDWKEQELGIKRLTVQQLTVQRLTQ